MWREMRDRLTYLVPNIDSVEYATPRREGRKSTLARSRLTLNFSVGIIGPVGLGLMFDRIHPLHSVRFPEKNWLGIAISAVIAGGYIVSEAWMTVGNEVVAPVLRVRCVDFAFAGFRSPRLTNKPADKRDRRDSIHTIRSPKRLAHKIDEGRGSPPLQFPGRIFTWSGNEIILRQHT